MTKEDLEPLGGNTRKPALTAGQVREYLARLPAETPVFVGTGDGGFPAVEVQPMWDSESSPPGSPPTDVWISAELPNGAWRTMEMRPWPEEKV